MSRFKAAFIHLVISTVLATLVICLLLFGWYPLPFFWAIGGPALLALIVGVDVILGPLMTMILFNTNKSRRALTLDLSLIAIVQFAAMGYGLYSGNLSRLVFNVFDGQSFQLVQAGDVAGNFLQQAKLPEYKSLPVIGQRYAALSVPTDDKTQSDLAFYAALGVGPKFMPDFYVPLAEARAALMKASVTVQQLPAKHPKLATDIETVLKAQALGWSEVAIVPFEVKTQTHTTLVALNPLRVIKVLTENPR